MNVNINSDVNDVALQHEVGARGAVVKGNKPIDQLEAANRFIAAQAHEKMHDNRLWDLRKKRDAQMHLIPEWEELRQLASDIKEHTLDHLAHYLEMFEKNAKDNGIHVHWAQNAEECNSIAIELMKKRQTKILVKSKSMLGEECGLRKAVEKEGINVIETDLGERIQQLDNEDPSHVVVPAVHKSRTDVSRVFTKTLGAQAGNNDIHYLAETQRETNRPLILKAEAGMTGGNFLVAETGAVVVCTNEGNADLSANTPGLHIVTVGIEKIVPGLEHLAVFIRLLSRSALGSPITQYTSYFRGPRHHGGEMHVILVDNTRSTRLADKKFKAGLKCIRCGACMNTCPVFRRSGGLSYGSTYAGPIGLILSPGYNAHKFRNLPFASTLNGSCSNVCPVKINIHEQIFEWRETLAEKGELSLAKRILMQAAGKILGNPVLYRAAIKNADRALKYLPHFIVYNNLNKWGKQRDLPPAPKETFHGWYEKNYLKKESVNE